MKNNKKSLELVEKGLSSSTVLKLTESQIDTLHKKLFVEQTMVSKTDATTISKLKSEKKPFQVYEKEMEEQSSVEVDKDNASSGEYTQDMPQKPAPDGMDDDLDNPNEKNSVGTVESIEEEKKDGPNAWAICHSQVGPKKSRKWERCVREIKKQIKEGKNPYLPIMEAALAKMVEKHISPKMTKSELINTLSEQGIISRPFKNSMMGFVGNDELDKPVEKMYISKKETMEQGTKTAPTRVKPGTKEKEKPGKDPFKHPKHQPKPKAEKIDEQGTKTAPPVVKPGTKEKPKTSDPFKNPKHQPKPKASTKAPKMGTVKIPDYLEFDQLKIDFKNQ